MEKISLTNGSRTGGRINRIKQVNANFINKEVGIMIIPSTTKEESKESI